MDQANAKHVTLPLAPVRPVSALHCYLAYGLALTTGYVSWHVIRDFGYIRDPFWAGLAVSCIATVVIWLFSIKNDNSSIYDPYWVVAPPLLAALLISAGNLETGAFMNLRQAIILVCLALWAARYHLFYRWSGWRSGLTHEDWRYEEMRRYPMPYWLNSLLGMHLFPTFLVYFAFAPAAITLVEPSAYHVPFGLWDLLGLIMALTAVAIQYFADEQLRRFRNSEAYDAGGSFRGGLWNYSRHPNYFGEVLFWFSMISFAIGSGVIHEFPVLSIAGPIIMAIFFRVSAWMMDMRSLRRRPGYAEIMKEVSALIPWFPGKSQ